MKNSIFSLLLGLFLFCSNFLRAQRGNNWVLASTTGINFNTNPPTIFVKSGGGGYSQSVSDCEGKLQIYAHNMNIYNSSGQLIKNNPKYTGDFNLLIPKPGDDSAFYYFRQVYNVVFPYYITIDMRLDSGRGACDTILHQLIDTNAFAAGFVKHANDTDYWLLVKTNPDSVKAYLVTNKGIDSVPIISNMYGAKNYVGFLRFSNNGKFVISTSTYGQAPLPSSDRTYVYNFDAKTGKCSNGRVLYNIAGGPSAQSYTYCFSPNDSFIYHYMIYGDVIIRQFETYNSVPYNTRQLIYSRSITSNNGGKSYSLQTAPDNRIYFWETDSGSSSHCLSYIAYPDVKGIGCNVQSEKACFWPNLISARFFPAMFFPIKRINNHFTVTGADGCGTDTVRFRMDADSSFHSAWWYFGDGDSSQEFYIRDSLGNKQWQGITHQYKQEGSYYVRLACGLGPCGYKQWVGDSITIQFKPNLKFTTNKNIYCGYQTIDANLNFNYTDTLKLSWGDGTDTLLIKGSTAILDSNTLQHTYTQNGNYTISCKAWNTHCLDSQTITYPVYISAKPQALFTTNNKASCGSSTFTFIDTSGFDSIVNYRYWRITPPNGNTYTQATTNTNLLNQTLSDTGSYHITLVVESNQGCIDSLPQQNYISVYPLPNTTITPSGKVYICYNDSVKLTIANNTKYLWNTGDTTSSIFIKKQGNYSATVWNSYNCTSKTANTTATVLAPFNATIIKTNDSLYIQTNRTISGYLWLRDSLTFAGNTQRSITNPTNGNYTATITDTNGCQTKTNSVKVYNGIETLYANSTIYIYPNPTQNILCIETTAPIKTITLQDLTGKQIPIAPTNNKTTTQLNLSSLAKGVYILKVNEVYKKVVVE